MGTLFGHKLRFDPISFDADLVRSSSFSATNILQKSIQIVRQRSGEVQLVTAVIWKGNGLGMQEQSPKPELFRRSVHVRISISLITGNRVARMQGMHTDLMSPPGPRLTLHQAELTEGPGKPQHRLC